MDLRAETDEGAAEHSEDMAGNMAACMDYAVWGREHCTENAGGTAHGTAAKTAEQERCSDSPAGVEGTASYAGAHLPPLAGHTFADGGVVVLAFLKPKLSSVTSGNVSSWRPLHWIVR